MTQGIKEAVKHGKFMLYNSGNLNFSKLEIDTVQTLIDYALSSQATKVSGLPGFKQEGLKILKKLVQSYTGMPDETVDFCLDDKYFDQALKEIGDLPIVRSQVSVKKIEKLLYLTFLASEQKIGKIRIKNLAIAIRNSILKGE